MSVIHPAGMQRRHRLAALSITLVCTPQQMSAPREACEEMSTCAGVHHAPTTPVETEFRLNTCHLKTC
jgi:hypothetical protein